MLAFSAPIIIGSLFQMTYNAVDSIIVGRYIGTAAASAVGSATPVMNVAIFFISGICLGASVLMGEFFGAKNYKMLKCEVSTTLITGIIFSLAVALICFFTAIPMLKLLNVREEIIDSSAAYLKIVFVGLIFTFLYNFFSNTLRSIGNSTIPLYFLIFSSVLNIALDFVFIAVIGMDVTGVAWATVISQAVSSLLCIVYIYARVPLISIKHDEFKIDVSLLKKTFSYSWATAAQQASVYFARMLVQSAVNPLSISSVAVYNACARIDDFTISPFGSIASALTVFASQNKGACKPDRIRRGFVCNLVMEIIYWLILLAPILVFSRSLVHFFLPDEGEEVISLGVRYLRLMVFAYPITGATNTFQGYFRGVGMMKVTLISTLIQASLRVTAAYLLAPIFDITAIAYACYIGWSAMLVYEITVFILMLRKQ
ncbi:MAG: MATE family efflux transporter [Oscillospiraceae bacterium]